MPYSPNNNEAIRLMMEQMKKRTGINGIPTDKA